MKKRYQSAAIGVYILIVLAGVIWHAGGVSAEDTIKLTVNSHTTSKAIMDNMQPGDTMASNYTVINDGNERIDYFVDFKFGSGNEELFKILQMTLQKEGVILYSGVMSEAEGRIAVGSLAAGGREVIQMDVTFPLESGNEYQGKTTSVTFGFSASASPEPSAEPSATPAASASPDPSASPGTTPAASASPDPSAGPSATPAASASPDPSSGPGTTPGSIPTAAPTAGSTPVPGVIITPGPSPAPTAAPALTASPDPEEISVSEGPVPLGGTDHEASPAPDAGGSGSTNTATPSPDNEVTLDDDELPLSGPDTGDKLPDTAEPWYNLLLISMAVAIFSVIVLRRLNSKK
ncbi:hypothetical protein C2I18_10975 [Paenibacillus sp. PK3_47]|uniref:hypothetical protein n=1 Tax=Paenibacillus sp. PK3_47 TaxID=2072642 RepID=UPI00201DE341|nr:hypothetical protein [Paenibacillus sp. PK3_47]UQZ34005.1 hypothetical protein C2I18_10975 [Paenibacillus sp. PK3_47]